MIARSISKKRTSDEKSIGKLLKKLTLCKTERIGAKIGSVILFKNQKNFEFLMGGIHEQTARTISTVCKTDKSDIKIAPRYLKKIIFLPYLRK